MIKCLDFNNNMEIARISKFLMKNTFSEYTQDTEWNLIRNENIKYFLYYENKQHEIQWTCNLLDKSNDKLSILYAPRGPVLDYNDKKIVKLFFEEIKKWMNLYNYERLIINPCISYEKLDCFPKELKYKITEPDDYNNLLDSCKLAIMNVNGNEMEMLNKLPSKFRQNTRRSYRKDLTSKISTKVDLDNFYKLYIDTSKRHNFKPHNLEYFEKICEIYKDKLIFIEIWYKNIPLAMSVDILYKDKLIYLYGVSSSENRNLLGMYNLQWEVIKYCIDNKIPKYDFGGVFCTSDDINNKDYGLYNFKKGYCYDGFIDIVPDIIIDFERKDK